MSALAPKLVEADSPDTAVLCRVCGVEKEARQMGGHIGSSHKMKITQYVETYGESASRDFSFHRAADKVDDGPTTLGEMTLEDDLLKTLSGMEKRFYHDYSQEIFQQIDRDIAQWPVVMSLTLDMIQLTKLRSQQMTDKLKDPKITQAIATAVKSTEERIRAQMAALGISREAKLKNRAQVKTTPFSLISGYLDELERMTPQQAASLEAEERKQLAAMNERIAKLYFANVPDLNEAKEDEDGSVSSLDIERIIADANIEV